MPPTQSGVPGACAQTMWPHRSRSRPRRKVLQSSGLYRDEVLIDHNGTPSDPSDDEFVEFVGNVKPPQHDPFVGRDFCEDFLLFTS